MPLFSYYIISSIPSHIPPLGDLSHKPSNSAYRMSCIPFPSHPTSDQCHPAPQLLPLVARPMSSHPIPSQCLAYSVWCERTQHWLRPVLYRPWQPSHCPARGTSGGAASGRSAPVTGSSPVGRGGCRPGMSDLSRRPLPRSPFTPRPAPQSPTGLTAPPTPPTSGLRRRQRAQLHGCWLGTRSFTAWAELNWNWFVLC